METTADDRLDIEQPGALVAYLRAHELIEADEEPKVTVLAGGVSNRTVLVERDSDDAWVVKQALAKLRVAVDWFSSPERIHREASGLFWLGELAPKGTITRKIYEDPDDHILVMSAVPQPHENWKTVLLRGEVQSDHVRQFATLIGYVHRNSNRWMLMARSLWKELYETLVSDLGDRNFFETLRVEPYYRYTATQVPEAAGFYATLIDDTYSRQDTIVHGDFSPKNVLVHGGRLILLDHEVIHLGDPGFDLGFGMTHLLSKAHHLPEHRAAFRDAAVSFWDTYWQTVSPGKPAWTHGLESRAVRHTLGCLLARVRGRSPLEYLGEDARARQARAVSAIMAQPPGTVAELAAAFIMGIEEQNG